MLEYEKHRAYLKTVFSVIPLIFSFLAIVNWLLRALTSFTGISVLSVIAPATMLSIFTISVLIILRGYYKNLRWNLMDFLLLGLVFIYCVNVLLDIFWDVRFRPEEILLNQELSPLRSLISPMSPFSALFLIFLCISYLVLYAPFFQIATKRRFSGYFSLLAFGGTCLAILSNISKVKMLPAMGLVPISMLASLLLFTLSLALLESVDLGILRVLYYVSGNVRDKKQSFNQLNAFIYLFIVFTALLTTVLLLQGEKRSMKQNLREQLVLNLDANKNAMNLWLKDHYNSLNEVVSDPQLTMGMVDIFRGNSFSENAEYARYWARIIQKQHYHMRLAIYDPLSGKQKSFSESINFPPQELRRIEEALKQKKDILVQSELSNVQNTRGGSEAIYLRFWALLPDNAGTLLLLLELQPNEYIQKSLTQYLGDTQTNHNHLFSYENGELQYISEPLYSSTDSICTRIRSTLNTYINAHSMDFEQLHFSEDYDSKGAVVYFAADKLDYLPWIMVQSLNSARYERELAKWPWFFAGICTLLFYWLAYFMHQSSRRKSILDDQTALQEWLNTFNAVPSAIWLMDSQGNIQRSNNAIEQLFGIQESEVTGRYYQDVIPGLVPSLDSALLQTGLEVHSEFGHANRWFSSSVAPILDENGKPHSFVQIISDITEKKENIHRLEASEIRFRAIFDQSPIGISIISADLLYLSINNSFIRFLGYEEKELLGMKLCNTAHPDYTRQLEKGVHNLLAGETKVFRLETRFIRKDGGEIWGLLICILISDSSLEGDFVLAMVENIQDRVQAMQELYRAKEMAVMSERLKSSFMQNISHEFRTPLNGILGFSQVLKAGNTDQEAVMDYADSIYQSGKRMQQLIENIISFAKVDSGQENLVNNPFSLKQMLNKIYDLYKSRALKKNLDLCCDLAPEYEQSVLISDESKIIQIIAKLMDNAIGFTEHGKVECSGYLENNILILQVKDTGIGIPEAKQSSIFDSFYQADMSFTRTHDGVGLGLSICKGLANILSGDISVKSELNVGTVFVVKIPVKIQK